MKMMAIYNYPDYKAGEDGHIYSFKLGTKRKLKAGLDGKKRYLHVTLCKNGVPKILLVHRLICAAFHGKPLGGETTSHLDGNCTNNVPENLSWETHQENCLRKQLHGTYDGGVLNSRAKFDSTQIKEIRQLLAKGHTARSVAKKFKCQDRLIGKIKRGEHYKV